jgi:hypothetical protein
VPSFEIAGAQFNGMCAPRRVPASVRAATQPAVPSGLIRAMPLRSRPGAAAVAETPKYIDPSGPVVTGVVTKTFLR